MTNCSLIHRKTLGNSFTVHKIDFKPNLILSIGVILETGVKFTWTEVEKE